MAPEHRSAAAHLLRCTGCGERWHVSAKVFEMGPQIVEKFQRAHAQCKGRVEVSTKADKRERGRAVGEWHFQTVLQNQTRRGDRLLQILITGPPPGHGWQWGVTVVEMAAPPADGESGPPPASDEIMRTFFADHAHEVLETQRSLADAMALAERYARWWQGSRASHFVCACEPISASERGP